jgi:hypothetical protein
MPFPLRRTRKYRRSSVVTLFVLLMFTEGCERRRRIEPVAPDSFDAETYESSTINRLRDQDYSGCVAEGDNANSTYVVLTTFGEHGHLTNIQWLCSDPLRLDQSCFETVVRRVTLPPRDTQTRVKIAVHVLNNNSSRQVLIHEFHSFVKTAKAFLLPRCDVDPFAKDL